MCIIDNKTRLDVLFVMLFRNQASAGSFCVCQGHVDALFALKHSESVKKLQICLQMCAGVLVCMKKYVKSVSL